MQRRAGFDDTRESEETRGRDQWSRASAINTAFVDLRFVHAISKALMYRFSVQSIGGWHFNYFYFCRGENRRRSLLGPPSGPKAFVFCHLLFNFADASLKKAHEFLRDN